MPGGVGRDGQGGGFRERHLIGNRVGVDGWRRDVLGVAAIYIDPDAQLARAPLVVAAGAVFAEIVTLAFHAVIQQDPVANLQIGAGVGADLHYFPGDIAAQDVREASAVIGTEVQIQVIQGAGAHPQQNLARANLRLGTVSHRKHVGPLRFR